MERHEQKLTRKDWEKIAKGKDKDAANIAQAVLDQEDFPARSGILPRVVKDKK